MGASVTVASTDHVAAADRLTYWEEYNARELVGLRCTTYHDEGLTARETNLDLGTVKLADITGNAHVIDRSPEHVARTPKSSLFVSHLVAGRAFFVHAGGCLRLTGGDTVLYDSSRPYLFGFETQMHQVLLDLPGELLSDRTGDDATVPPGQPIKVGGANGRSLARLMRTLAEASARGDVIDQESTSTRLLAAAVAVIRPDAAGDALVRAAGLDIERRLSDPDLTAESVARAVGVTSRHLNRLLAAEGTSLGREISRARLEAAREDLADPACADLPIADIAARWGFSSHAHLTRSFRQEYAITPRDWRAMRDDARRPRP